MLVSVFLFQNNLQKFKILRFQMFKFLNNLHYYRKLTMHFINAT
jgi:hypothetical protein